MIDIDLVSLLLTLITLSIIWDKVFKNGSSKICGRQPLKNFKGYGLLKQNITHEEYFLALNLPAGKISLSLPLTFADQKNL